MKKLLALVLVAGMVAFVACGPSKEDQEKKEKAKQDSIKAAEKAKTEADSLAKVEKEKNRIDSLKKDSIEKSKKNQGSYHPGTSTQTTTHTATTTTTTQPKGTRPGGTTK
jgi:Flp pilus assembly protein TadB